MTWFDFIITGSIPARIQYIAIAASFLLFAGIIYLIRKSRLKEGYSILWFVIAVTVVLFSLFTRLLDLFASFMGISYAPAVLFLLLVGGLFLLSLHFSVLATRHDKKLRELAQEHAILKANIERKFKQK